MRCVRAWQGDAPTLRGSGLSRSLRRYAYARHPAQETKRILCVRSARTPHTRRVPSASGAPAASHKIVFCSLRPRGARDCGPPSPRMPPRVRGVTRGMYRPLAAFGPLAGGRCGGSGRNPAVRRGGFVGIPASQRAGHIGGRVVVASAHRQAQGRQPPHRHAAGNGLHAAPVAPGFEAQPVTPGACAPPEEGKAFGHLCF